MNDSINNTLLSALSTSITKQSALVNPNLLSINIDDSSLNIPFINHQSNLDELSVFLFIHQSLHYSGMFIVISLDDANKEIKKDVHLDKFLVYRCHSIEQAASVINQYIGNTTATFLRITDTLDCVEHYE